MRCLKAFSQLKLVHDWRIGLYKTQLHGKDFIDLGMSNEVITLTEIRDTIDIKNRGVLMEVYKQCYLQLPQCRLLEDCMCSIMACAMSSNFDVREL
jgi:hypothetical protein